MEYLFIKDNIILAHFSGGYPNFDKELGIEVKEYEECNINLGDDIRIYKDIATGSKKTSQELLADKVISKEEYNEKIDILRKQAYREEADPLCAEFVRGDVEKSVWLEKIEEIKKRYPKV